MADEQTPTTPAPQPTAPPPKAVESPPTVQGGTEDSNAPTPGLQFRLPPKALGYISQAEQSNGLPEGSLLGLFTAENRGFKSLQEAGPHTKSSTGARGPFQLTTSALIDAGYDPKKFNWNSFSENAQAAGKYAKIILDRTEAKGLGGMDPHLRLAGGFNAGYNDLITGVKSGEITPDLAGVDKLSAAKGNGTYGSYYMAAFPNGTKASASGTTKSSERAEAQPSPQPGYGAPIIERVGTAPSQAGGFDSAISAAKTASTALWENAVKPVWDGISQFPGEIVDNAMALNDQGAHLGLGAIDALTGSTMESSLPPSRNFKPIDPYGVANFVASTYTPGFGGPAASMAKRLAARGVNALTATGSTVLNIADARAKQQATQQGLDWNGLGSGDRISRIADHLDTSVVADNLPSILTNAGIGFLLTPNSSAQSKVAARKDAIMGEYEAKVAHVEGANRDYIDYQTQTRRGKQWETAAANVRDEGETVFYNAQQEEKQKINDAAQEAYAARLAKVQPQLDAATEITGLDVMPNDAWAYEKKAQNRQARDILMQEMGAEQDNPASPIFTNWLGTDWAPTPEAQRVLDPESVTRIDETFDKIRDVAKASNRADSEFAKLGRRLGDPENIQGQIDELEGKINKIGAGGDEAQKAIWEAQIQELEAKMPEPTVGDLINRVQAIDEVRRTKAFSTSATSREKKMLEDVSNMLRDPDPEKGLVTQALTPDEAKIWTEGNLVSRQWWQKKRAADMVMSAFGDSRPGASQIVHTLTAKETAYRAQFGDEVYSRLHELAGAIDTLMDTIPPPPKQLQVGPQKTFVPKPMPPDFRPNPDKIRQTPKAPNPDEWKRLAADSTGGKILDGVNKLLDKGGRTALGIATGAAGVYGYSHGGLSLGQLMLSGGAAGFLLTVPAASKAFVEMVRYMDRPQSREYLNALARLTTASMIHNAYTPQPAMRDPVPNPGALAPQSQAVPRVPTKIATRPTGGPIPAPPTSTPVPAGSPPPL